MSASETNIEKQTRRHKGPLVGMGLGVGFALVLLLVFVGYQAYLGDEPDGAEVQIDGRTGAEVVATE